MSRNNYIIDLSRNEGLNISDIRKITGHSRDKIREVLNGEFPTIKSYKRRESILDPYKVYIDEWLLNDLGVHYKQRHTAKRIFDRLACELGYTGGVRIVEKYVKSKKSEISIENRDTYLQLNRPLEEAQVDFGEFYYYDSTDTQRKAYHLVVAFPSSNAEFTQVFKGENQQCLFEGLKRIFEYIGGVPKRIVFDNMTTAIAQVGKGKERTMTNEFIRFKAHYGFQPIFCNPASGNEKAHVEINVGYVRRNAFVPLPKIECFDVYNEKLFQTCDQFNERVHYKHKVSINKLFEQNKVALLQLPRVSFTPTKLIKAKSNRNAYVRFENTYYSASPKHVECELFLEVGHDQVKILDSDYQLIDIHERDYEGKDSVVNWFMFLPVIQKKPTALKYSHFYNVIDSSWRDTFDEMDNHEIQSILSEFGTHILSDDQVLKSVLFECKSIGKVSTDSLKVMYRKAGDHVEIPSIPLPEYVPNITAYQTSASDYNDLMGGNR